jgi:hypothetical protein
MVNDVISKNRDLAQKSVLYFWVFAITAPQASSLRSTYKSFEAYLTREWAKQQQDPADDDGDDDERTDTAGRTER